MVVELFECHLQQLAVCIYLNSVITQLDAQSSWRLPHRGLVLSQFLALVVNVDTTEFFYGDSESPGTVVVNMANSPLMRL